MLVTEVDVAPDDPLEVDGVAADIGELLVEPVPTVAWVGCWLPFGAELCPPPPNRIPVPGCSTRLPCLLCKSARWPRGNILR